MFFVKHVFECMFKKILYITLFKEQLQKHNFSKQIFRQQVTPKTDSQEPPAAAQLPGTFAAGC